MNFFSPRFFQRPYLFLFLALTSFVSLFSPVDAQNEKVMSTRMQSVAVTNDGGRIFVLNDNNTVNIYASATGKLISTELVSLPLIGKRTAGSMLFSPSNKFILVDGENKDSYHFELFETSSFQNGDDYFKKSVAFASIPLDGIRNGVLKVFSPDESKIYFVDSFARVLHVFDIATKNITPLSIDIKEPFVDFVVSPTGEEGYLLTLDPGRLIVVSLLTGVIHATYNVGDRPSSMLYNEVLGKVYVTNRSSDSVSILDTKKKNLISVKSGIFPYKLDYDEETGHVFIASNGDGTIIDMAPDNSMRTIRLETPGYASYPIDVWYSQITKRLVAVNPYSQDLYIIDTKSGAVVYQEKEKGWPTAIVGSENDIAVVLSQNTSDITVANTKSTTVSRITSVGTTKNTEEGKTFSAPLNLRYYSKSNRLFVSNLGTGDISVVDGKTLKLITRISVGFQPRVMFLSEKKDKLYVVNPAGGYITVVDLSKENYTKKNIQVGGLPQVINSIESLDKLYVTLSAKNSVGVIDMLTDTLVGEIPLGPQSRFPFVLTKSEDRKEVYVANYAANSVIVIDAVKGAVSKIVTVGTKPLWLLYHHATQLLLTTIEGGNEVAVIDPKSATVIQRIKTKGIPYRVLSDDATGVVYVNHRGDQHVEIYKANDKNTFSFFDMRDMDFIGQTGSLYDMMTTDAGGRISQDTKRVYISSSKNDMVVTALISRDKDGIMKLTKESTVFEDGDVKIAPPVLPVAKAGSSFNIMIGLGFLVVCLLFVLWKTRGSSKSTDGSAKTTDKSINTYGHTDGIESPQDNHLND